MDFYHTDGRIEKLENQRNWLYRADSGGYQWRGENPMPSEYRPKPIMHRYSVEEEDEDDAEEEAEDDEPLAKLISSPSDIMDLNEAFRLAKAQHMHASGNNKGPV